MYINYYLLLFFLKKPKRRNTPQVLWCEASCQVFFKSFFICSSFYSFEGVETKIVDPWPRTNISFIHTTPSYNAVLFIDRPPFVVEEIMFTCKEVTYFVKTRKTCYPSNGLHCCHLYTDFPLILDRQVYAHNDMFILLYFCVKKENPEWYWSETCGVLFFHVFFKWKQVS